MNPTESLVWRKIWNSPIAPIKFLDKDDVCIIESLRPFNPRRFLPHVDLYGGYWVTKVFDFEKVGYDGSNTVYFRLSGTVKGLMN